MVGDFVKYQKSYCCLSDNSKIYKSAILFIGDSHVEEYIAALINSEYKYKYHLIHIYIDRDSYDKYLSNYYLKLFIPKYHFKLCLIGNYITSENIYSQIEKLAEKVLQMCDKVLISNDNPNHFVDPNSCLSKNKDDCYGELNKTCILPKKFSIPKNDKIEVVQFWDDNIINGKKCLYYYNYLPLYTDINHLSSFYLNYIVKKVDKIISNYVEYDYNYKHDNICPYYLMPKTKFHHKNLNKQSCN